MAHRGPDASGLWVGPREGLAHRRLSIIDVSPTGAQPMASTDGSLVVSFNGEIYNYRELRAELTAQGLSFRGSSDTEVLLKLYESYGEAMLSRLNGIFAFGLWDARSGNLFVARDHLGVKPVYFAETSCGFAFASELKGLLRLAPEMRQLDVPALDRYLTFLCCPGEGTPLRGVRKLGPGEALRVRAGRIAKRWTWYQLPAFRGVAAPMSEAEAISGTLAHVREAVQQQTVADVPIGAFLSGGLDSSAVVALAREVVPNLQCFTIETQGEFEGGQTDDLPYARRVAEHLRVPLEVLSIEARGMMEDLERMVWSLEEPLSDPATLNVLYISERARQSGIKVLLSGTGGDNLFCGYRRHLAVNLERYWRWLPRGLRRALERVTSGLDQKRTVFRRLSRFFAGADLEGDAHLANYFRWISQPELLPLYSAEARAQLAHEGADAPLLDFLRPLPAGLGPLERMLVLEQRFDLIDHNLTYTDKMGMAAGVEIRVPLLAPAIVDFAARIPIHMKQRGRTGKWVFKEAMGPYLPRDVIYRPKAGFGAPLRCWMRDDGFRSLMRDVLSPEALTRRGIFDPIAVHRLMERTRSGAVDGAYTLLSLLCVEVWCRQFIDARPAELGATTVSCCGAA